MVKRHIESILHERMRDEPVIAIQGPRAVGKTTLLTTLARRTGSRIVDLDDLATREAAAEDPAVFVSGPSPVLIDEYQHVPQILDAIKAELNKNGDPGRFVITGSTRHDALPAAAQALTGRLHIITIYPLSRSEIQGSKSSFVDQLFTSPLDVVDGGTSTTSRGTYIDFVTQGGFPMVLGRRPSSRSRWFDDYVTLCLERDAASLGRIAQREALPQLLKRLAGQSGQVLNLATVASDIGLNVSTTGNYTKLLEALFLVRRLPAWGKTLSARATSRPKLHVVDSGLAARLLGVTPENLDSLDPTKMQQYGHLLETYVVGELWKQVEPILDGGLLGHWRTPDNQEVDLVIERRDSDVVAFEVKSGPRVSSTDRAGLRVLKKKLGDRLRAGVVLYTGERSFVANDGIIYAPIDRIWAS